MTPEQHIRGAVFNAVTRALDNHDGPWVRLGIKQAIADAVIAALPEHGLTITAAPSSDTESDPALAEIERLARELYQAQDALAFVRECCDIADRNSTPVTTALVREWLEGAKCGRQLLAERKADHG